MKLFSRSIHVCQVSLLRRLSDGRVSHLGKKTLQANLAHAGINACGQERQRATGPGLVVRKLRRAADGSDDVQCLL